MMTLSLCNIYYTHQQPELIKKYRRYSPYYSCWDHLLEASFALYTCWRQMSVVKFLTVMILEKTVQLLSIYLLRSMVMVSLLLSVHRGSHEAMKLEIAERDQH